MKLDKVAWKSGFAVRVNQTHWLSVSHQSAGEPALGRCDDISRCVGVVFWMSSPVSKWLIQSFSGGPCPTPVTPPPSDCPQRTSLSSCCGLRTVNSESSHPSESFPPHPLTSSQASLKLSKNETCLINTEKKEKREVFSQCVGPQRTVEAQRPPGFCTPWDPCCAVCVLHTAGMAKTFTIFIQTLLLGNCSL